MSTIASSDDTSYNTINEGYGHAQDTPPLFQCQPSSEQDGLVFTPNIPDFYFNFEKAGNFRAGPGANLTTLSQDISYIFTIPPVSSQRDCSGTVVAMQFCYEYRDNRSLGTTVNAFQFFTLTRDGIEFTVDSSFTVQTTLTTCTDDLSAFVSRVCCSKVTSNEFGELVIPSYDYIFGIAHIRDSQIQLLALNPPLVSVQYLFDQFQVTGFSPPPGTTTPLSESTLVTDGPLPLLRFFIGNSSQCVHVMIFLLYSYYSTHRKCNDRKWQASCHHWEQSTC